MDIKGLEYFIKAAELMNFTKAADECAITQTAMSQHIRNMEKQLGFRLFERDTRNVKLTAAGEVFYERALNVVEDYNLAVKEAQETAKGNKGRIRIFFGSYMEAEMILPRLSDYKRGHPDVSIEISARSPSFLPTMLDKGQCDIAVTWPNEFDPEKFDSYPLKQYGYVIVCSKEHRFASFESLSLNDIGDEPIMALDLSDSPKAMSNFLKQTRALGLNMIFPSSDRRLITIQDMMLNLSLDRETPAFMPEFVCGFLPDTHCAVPIREHFELTVSAIIRKNDPKPQAVKLMEHLIMQEYA